jgi:acetyl esterase/lipase
VDTLPVTFVTPVKHFFLCLGLTPKHQIIIGGDSAGGHLALSLLSHLHHPRPEDDLSINLDSHLCGCFVVSPLLSLNSLTTRSYRQRFSVDSLSYKTIREWGSHLIDYSPWREEISQGLGWGMALDVPESWWQDLKIVDHILVTGGHEEFFRDHIAQFVEVLRRKSSVDLTAYIALDEAHDGPLMDFRAHRQPGTSTNTVTEWIISTFSNTGTSEV